MNNMTIKEALDRVKRLDIRDAESDDYVALYMVIQLAIKGAKAEDSSITITDEPYY